MLPRSLRGSQEQGATFVELFFDLVFVFAVTQVTSVLGHDLTWTGLLQGLVVFWLVWWAWTQFTWTLNQADTEHQQIRFITLLATAFAFVMALAIPGIDGPRGWMFPLAYLLVRAPGLWLQIRLAAGDSTQLAAVRRWVTSSSLGLLAVAAAVLLDGSTRLWALGAAALLDVFAALRSGSGEWRLFPGHFAERHGLIVIIALGESLIAAGIGANDQELRISVVVASTIAVFAVCALWWTYFGWGHAALERQLSRQTPEHTGRFARDVFSFGHFPIVAGVIGVAVAVEEAVAHATSHLGTGAALALAIGVSLFVGGSWLALRRAGVSVGWVRLAATGIVLALVPVLTTVPAWIALGIVALLVAGVAVIDRAPA